jgi:hypothetical protein
VRRSNAKKQQDEHSIEEIEAFDKKAYLETLREYQLTEIIN